MHVALTELDALAKTALRDIEQVVISEAFKTALRKAIKLAKLGPQSAQFQIQALVGIMFTFDLQGIEKELEGWIKHPPVDTHSILAFIKAVAPEQIQIFAGGGIALGLQIDVQAGVTFDRDTLIANWSDIIKEFS